MAHEDGRDEDAWFLDPHEDGRDEARLDLFLFFSDAHRSDLARQKIAGFVCLDRIWINRQEIVDMVRRLDEIVQRLDSNGSRRKNEVDGDQQRTTGTSFKYSDLTTKKHRYFRSEDLQ
jgi:hypothetical protein